MNLSGHAAGTHLNIPCEAVMILRSTCYQDLLLQQHRQKA